MKNPNCPFPLEGNIHGYTWSEEEGLKPQVPPATTSQPADEVAPVDNEPQTRSGKRVGK